MDPFPPITHVAVTVSDLERSVPWYRDLFDCEPALDEDTGPFRHVVFPVGTMLFGLHAFPDRHVGSFDERRIGLDQVSFGVDRRADPETWAWRLDDLGVAHGAVVDASYGSGLSFRDPDGIALELFAPPSTGG